MLTIKKIIFPLLVVLHIVCRFIWADAHEMSLEIDTDTQKQEVAYQNFLHENPNIAQSLQQSNVEKWQIDRLVALERQEAYLPLLSLFVE